MTEPSSSSSQLQLLHLLTLVAEPEPTTEVALSYCRKRRRKKKKRGGGISKTQGSQELVLRGASERIEKARAAITTSIATSQHAKKEPDTEVVLWNEGIKNRAKGLSSGQVVDIDCERPLPRWLCKCQHVLVSSQTLAIFSSK